MITIRPFTHSDADYAAWAAVHNAVFPDYQLTPADFRRLDERQNPEHLFRRLLAESDGQLVGTAYFGHMSWNYHPRKFEIGLRVRPELRRRGIGGQLYAAALADLAAHQPISLRCQVREDLVGGLRFAERQGFAERMRAWESRLDVAAFDPARFAGQIERVERQGIALRTAAELEPRDPDFWAKLYALDTTLGHDVPNLEPFTPQPFEHWIGWFKDTPNFLPDGLFIAVDGERYVGLSALWRRSADDELDTGLTGVLADYRRRGIALALKLRAIDFARQRGTPVIRTDNASTNRPMLSINEALGFAKLPAWITMSKLIADE